MKNMKWMRRLLQWVMMAAAIILTTLSLSCKSCTKKGRIGSNNLYFPVFPDPIDEEGNAIPKYDKTTNSVVIPYSYWKMIIEYAAQTEAAVQALEAGYS